MSMNVGQFKMPGFIGAFLGIVGIACNVSIVAHKNWKKFSLIAYIVAALILIGVSYAVLDELQFKGDQSGSGIIYFVFVASCVGCIYCIVMTYLLIHDLRN
jgi:predicted membrane channel-forming protein YqfA (hemolysin III family)